jgi:serine/threonine protein kinase
MEGGKIYGKGFKGSVMNVSCNEEESLCTILKKMKILHIYDNTNKVYAIRDDLIDKFLNIVYEQKNTVVKQIKDKITFEDEIKNIRVLFGLFRKQTEKFTSFATLEFGGLNIIGFAIPGKMHYILNKACSITLKGLIPTISLNSTNKMINDLLSCMKILHSRSTYHADIKPENIMLCEETYKFVDWGNIKTESELKDLNVRPYASEFYASPIQWKINGKDVSYGPVTRLRFLGKFKFITGYDISLGQFNFFWDMYMKVFVNPQLNAMMRDSIQVLADNYYQCYSQWALGISLLILFVIRDYPKKYFDFVDTLLNIDHPQFSKTPTRIIQNFKQIILAK